MAGLLGLGAQRRLPLLIVGLAACGEPVSNAAFLEESRFLDALLAAEEVAPPASFATISPDDETAPLLRRALSAVDTYADFVALPVEICEQLREVGPRERSPVRRTWNPFAITVPVAEGPDGGQRLETAWVRADVLRTDDDRFEVLVEIASLEDGPWQTVGTAVVDGGEGGWRWELAEVVEALALQLGSPLEALSLTVEAEGGDFGRRVEVGYGDPPAFQGFWVLDGDDVFAFSGLFAVTEDDRTWPGQLTAVHTETGGGASGEVLVGEERLSFTSCWDGAGRGLWQGGPDPRIRSVGSPEGCPQP